jgi:hypothetical protein
MFITKSGSVVGSVDVAALTDHAATLGIDTDGLTQDELVTAVNAHAADVVVEDDTDDDDDAEDLSKLYKSELVERAEAAGIDTTGMSKAEVIDALEASESEGT